MRIAVGFALFFGLCSVSMGAGRFPYVASIVAPEVDVRSGPGLEFYETSVLRGGDKVEVYYESADWLAIRPPLGCFSWVSGRYVDLHLGNIGTVTVDGLAARIGSETGELCEAIQIKLKKGEKLLILDRKETPENAASPLWYKIAPPSGEYRWIPRSAITSSVGRSVANRQASVIIPVRYDEEIKTPEPLTPPPPVRTTGKPNRPSEYRLNNDVGTPGEIPLLAELLADGDPGKKKESPGDLSKPKELDPFQKAFEELKQETRVALTRPTDDWVFDILIKQGNYLYEIAPTDADLEKIYHLVETLQRTRGVRQEIAARRQFRSGNPLLPSPPSVGVPGQPVYGSNLAATQQAPSLVTTAGHQTETPGYDVAGKLGEFEPPLPKGHPPYAVVNEKGEITCYITPAPGVDLDSFIGKQVGINGAFGLYVKQSEPDKRHITAKSVTEMR